MHKQTPQKRVQFPRTLTNLVLGLLSIATILYGGFAFQAQPALAATSSTVNFQARLEGAGGSIAPDGLYNIRFKLYSASSGGSALWTEAYYDANGVTAGQDNRVQVTNGYVSVSLGSQTAFGVLTWDQNMWVTMDIGGTTQTATPTYDGEMAPRLQISAVPYAFRAGQLAIGNGSFQSTLTVLQPTVGNQTFQIADQAAAGTYQICVQGSTSGCNAASGSGFYIQNQNASVQTTSNFWISGSGRADTSLLSPAVDRATTGTLSIGTSANSTSITIGGASTTTTTVGATTTLNLNAPLIATNASTLALFNTNALTVSALSAATSIDLGASSGTANIHNPTLILGGSGITSIIGAGNAGLLLDTAAYSASSANSGAVTVRSGNVSGTTSNTGAVNFKSGNSTTSGNTGIVTIQSGDATSGNSGDVSIDVGNATGTKGNVNIGTSATGTGTVTIGASGATAKTTAVNIGNTTSSGGVSTIQIGGTGATNGSNTGTYVVLQAGQSVLQIANSGIAVNSLTNTPTAFQVQNASASSALVVDTTPLNSLVSNGSFEGGTTGWAAAGTGASLGQSSAEKYIGSASLAFTTGTAIGNSARLTVGAALSTSTTYNLSFYAKSNTAFNTLSASYSPTGAASTETDCAIFGNTRSVTTTGWTRYSCTINTVPTTPNGSGYIAIKQTDATSRIVYIDAVQLVAGGAITNGLVVINGFEGGTTGWSYSGTPGSVAQSAADKFNGTSSLLITTTANANNGAKYNSGNTNPTQLNDTSVYTLTFWAKSTGTALTTLAAAYSYDGFSQDDCVLNSTTLSTSVWQQYSCTFTTNALPTALSFFIIKNSAATVRTFYIDDVQVTDRASMTPNSLYREMGLALNGVINSPVALQNQTDSTTAFQLQNSAGTNILSVDSSNQRVSIGAIGSQAGQLYVSGNLPSTPTGSATSISSAVNIVIVGNYGYSATGYANTLETYDMTNPAAPVSLGDTGVVAGPLSNVTRSGDYLYVTADNKVLAYSISSPATPTQIGSVVSTGNFSYLGLATSGRYLYAAESGTSLDIIDISNPAKPQVVSTYGGLASSGALQIHGHYLYSLGSSGTSVEIYDISNPLDFTYVGSLYTGTGGAGGIAIEGRYAFITSPSAAEMYVYDISNPNQTNIQPIATSATSYNSEEIVIQGKYAYVNAYNYVEVFDISDRTNPLRVGRIATGLPIATVNVQGRYLYVGDNNFIHAFDLGGAYIQQLEAGGLKTSSIDVSGDGTFGGDVTVQGALTAAGANIQGDTAIQGAVSFTTAAGSTKAFQVQAADGSALFTIDTTNTINKLTNPHFENGVTGWSAIGGATAPTQNTNITYISHGDASMAYTAAGINQGVTTTSFTPAIVPAGTYVISFWMRVTNANLTAANIRVTLNDGSAHNCSPAASNFVTTGSLTRVFCNVSTSSNLVSLSITQLDATSRTIYIDSVQLEQNSAASPGAYRGAGIAFTGAFTQPLVVQTKSSNLNALQVINELGGDVFRVESAGNMYLSGTQFTAAAISSSTATYSIITTSGGTLNLGNILTTAINIGGTANSTTTIAGGDLNHTVAIAAAGTSTVQGVTIGSTSTSSSTAIYGGVNGANATITLQTASAGVINIGNSGVAGTIALGNTSGAVAQTINIGNNSFSGAANTIIINNSLATASTTTIYGGTQAGTAIRIETASTGGITIDSGTTGTISVGTGGSAKAVTVGSTFSTSKLTIQGGIVTTTNNQAGVVVAGGYSTSDTSLTALVLDSTTTFTETGSTCTSTVNGGALYFNSNVGSMALRICQTDSNWRDVITSDQMGILLLGVVDDSVAATNPGDLASVVGNGSGPCKVVMGSTTAQISWTACTAYSGGRKVAVAAGTNQAMTMTAGWVHVCLSGTNNQVVGTNGATEVANLSTLSMASVTAPRLCLADLSVNGSAITGIYDTRTFASTNKMFATVNSTAGLGQMVVSTATAGVMQLTTAATANQAKIQGVVVASTGAAATTTVNAIIATSGPAWVKATGGTANDYVQSSTAGGAGYAYTNAAISTGDYGTLGVALTPFTNTCTTGGTNNCRLSIFTKLNIK